MDFFTARTVAVPLRAAYHADAQLGVIKSVVDTGAPEFKVNEPPSPRIIPSSPTAALSAPQHYGVKLTNAATSLCCKTCQTVS